MTLTGVASVSRTVGVLRSSESFRAIGPFLSKERDKVISPQARATGQTDGQKVGSLLLLL
jgi:hypothetical protein